jgi:hypothetical protein
MGLPDFVKEEFDASPSLGAYSDTSMYLAYLECDILAHGHLTPALRRLRSREARRLCSIHPWIPRSSKMRPSLAALRVPRSQSAAPQPIPDSTRSSPRADPPTWPSLT